MRSKKTKKNVASDGVPSESKTEAETETGKREIDEHTVREKASAVTSAPMDPNRRQKTPSSKIGVKLLILFEIYSTCNVSSFVSNGKETSLLR